jgi:glycerol-3-phosphate acyltransferase PlsY
VSAAWPIAFGYVLGSVPFAFLLSRRWRGIDIRRAGSGNVGAANVLRTSGVATALAVVLLDIGKGAGTVLVAQRLTGAEGVPAWAGLAAVVGHVYPVWLRFRGAFWVLVPTAMLPVLAVFVITVWVTRFVSVGSVAASLALGPIAWALHAPPATVAVAGLAAGVIVFRHRSNLARLAGGTERRIGQRVS